MKKLWILAVPAVLDRKMEVKSRHQLIHRIGVYGGGDGPPRP